VRSKEQHADAAIRLLERAEGEARAASAADLGVPEQLVAANVMIQTARRLICEVFGWEDSGPYLPNDAR
jgi:hypothetical protein